MRTVDTFFKNSLDILFRVKAQMPDVLHLLTGCYLLKSINRRHYMENPWQRYSLQDSFLPLG